jgi:transposase
MMCCAIANPASCKILAVICFLHIKNMSAAEIHWELCVAVYGQNVMSKGTVRQWRRMFKDGWTNVHDEEQSSQPSIVSDDDLQYFDQKICERQRFTM